MADIVFTPAAGEAVWDAPAAPLTVGGVVVPGEGWRAWVTERDGTRVAEITDCNLGVISERLNDVPSFDLSVPKASVVAGEMHRVTREIQVYRDGGNPLFVGPILQRSASGSSGEMKVSCQGVGWYLTRRFGTKFDNGNLLLNPHFDQGLARWTVTGTVGLDSFHESYTQSAEFSGVNGSRLAQSVRIDSPGGAFRALLEVRAYVSGGSGPGWTVVLGARSNPGEFDLQVLGTASTEIPAGGGGVWETHTVALDVKDPASPMHLSVFIMDLGSGGTLYVNSVELYRFSFSGDPIGTEPYQDAGDQTQAIRELIQDRNRDLNIGVSTTPTDQLVQWEPQTDANQDTLEVVDRYVKRDNGIEWRILATPVTRTFTTFYPRMGRDIPDSEVTLRTVAAGVDPVNVADYSHSDNAAAAVSQMTTLGEGPHRGVATDGAAWGGLLLQSQQQAPSGTPRGDLVGLSLKALRKSTGETTVLTAVVSDGDLIHVVDLGDRVQVVIDDWDIQVDDVFRVVERKLDPSKDQMTLTLNPEPA